MDKIKALDEKIEIIRNDTNAYGFDDDNKTIAEAFELVSDMFSSQGEKGEKGEKGADAILPENIATIDQNGEQGNAYTKKQVDNLLENSGKNLGNSDLQLTSGEVRTLDITGAKFQIKGLTDKRADASFNKRLIVNDNGEFAVKEGADISINVTMPQTVNHTISTSIPTWIKHTISTQKLTADQERLLTIINKIGRLGWTKYSASEIIVNSLPVSQYPQGLPNGYKLPELIVENGVIRHSANTSINSKFQEQGYIQAQDDAGYGLLYNIIFDKELPSDKDWAVSYRSHSDVEHIFNYSSNNSRGNTAKLQSWGFRRDKTTDVFKPDRSGFRFFYAYSYSTKTLFHQGRHCEFFDKWAKNYFIKTGELLSFVSINEDTGEMRILTTDYDQDGLYLNLEAGILSSQIVGSVLRFCIKDISYWIDE